MTAALDVSYPADTVSEVGRSCAVETAERQNTEAEPYPLWDAQPVEIALLPNYAYLPVLRLSVCVTSVTLVERYWMSTKTPLMVIQNT